MPSSSITRFTRWWTRPLPTGVSFARLDWASGIFSATVGGESRWGDTHSRRFVNVNAKRGALTFDAQQQARTSNLYGELRAEAMPGFSLIAGGIYADGYRRQEQTFPAAVTGEASYDSFSPKFGLLWQPAPQVQLYANYSRSAEFPGFIELAQISVVRSPQGTERLDGRDRPARPDRLGEL